MRMGGSPEFSPIEMFCGPLAAPLIGRPKCERGDDAQNIYGEPGNPSFGGSFGNVVSPYQLPWRPWQGRQGMRHYNFDRSIAKLPENSSLAGEFVQHGRSIYVIFMMGLVLLTDFA
jgi:hypothetical protein